MTKIEYVAHEKSGVRYITLEPAAKRLATRVNLLDGLFIAVILAGVASLVIFLVK